ncbi:subtilisin family serine protease [Methanofollis sp. W23]|uniref:S8 family serine peptidase n=1 Tax=Methanofollis sp. W23 TaxID=2817849 RepID=UPI001AE988FE|nr:S8 family peptidase [Methanofollis sp. W23]MBP2144746.1 subtilisin family serine protease [Methanofollis sp. W23]
MRTSGIFPALLVLISLLSLVTLVQATGFSDDVVPDASLYQPDTVIVRFVVQAEDGPALCSVSENAHSALGADVADDLSDLVPGMQVVELPEDVSVEEAVDYYNRLSNVEYAEPNYYVHALKEPDDPYFEKLWGMKNTGQVLQDGQSFDGMLIYYNGQAGTPGADMKVPEAWNITTGSSNVTIAVIDSGVMYTHTDLAANIWKNPGEISDNGIDDDENGYVDDVYGWDFVDDDWDPMDFNGHGTHCAGTIAGVGNNSAGVAGVMWKAEIMPVRALDTQGYGTVYHSIAAIKYATMMGADIISCSFGGAEGSQAYRDAIRASSALVVCAAGNDGTDNDALPMYPANYNSPNILSVAALDNQDKFAIFSNYGAISVHVAAPGVGILSTVPQWPAAYEDEITESSVNDWKTCSYLESANWSGGYMSGTDRYAMGVSGVNVSLTYFNASFCDLEDAELEFVTAYTLKEGTDKLQILVSSRDFSTYALYNDMIESDDCYIADVVTGSSHRAVVSRTVGLDRYATMLDGAPLYIGYLYYSRSPDSFAWLDRFAITRYTEPDEGYAYYSGTSMATPMVSGVAGLIKSVNQSLTAEETKQILIDSVDVLPSLEGKVSSGGRVNATRAVLMARSTLNSSTFDLNENGIDVDIGDVAYVYRLARDTESEPDLRADYVEPYGVVDLADAQYISDRYVVGVMLD